MKLIAYLIMYLMISIIVKLFLLIGYDDIKPHNIKYDETILVLKYTFIVMHEMLLLYILI